MSLSAAAVGGGLPSLHTLMSLSSPPEANTPCKQDESHVGEHVLAPLCKHALQTGRVTAAGAVSGAVCKTL